MDATQFVEKYRPIYRDLYRFALCMFGNAHDAEDAVADSIAIGWEKRGQLRRPSSFKSWMFQIVANSCREKLRKAKRIEVTGPDDIELPESTEMDASEIIAVREAFATLPEVDRLIASLSIFGGYTSREIGTIVDLNPATVRSRRMRALKKMGRFLGGACL